MSAQKALHRTYRQMADMERILKASQDIEWTAVRPGWLLDEPITRAYEIHDAKLPKTIIRTRHADLAHFMLECATDKSQVGKSLAIGKKEHLRFENPLALLRDLV